MLNNKAMTTLKSTENESVVSGTRKSTRFIPSALTEKLVPVLLVLLLITLAAVLLIIGWSLIGVTPSA